MNFLEYTILIYFVISVAGVLILRTTANLPISKGTKFEKMNKKVSIIIPVRNEGVNIANCLDSLLKLDYDNHEIIVVDGHSDDNTQDIVRRYEETGKVRLIVEPPLPTGWVGKPWGCHIGQLEATGEVLLFTDADTIHSSNSLNMTVEYLEESKGFVSLVTTQQFRTFWEHMLVIVFLIISIAVNGAKGNEKSHIANGQYMMFSRETYDYLGGHTSVQNSIIEDLALGSYAALKGFPPQIIRQKNLVYARMYRSLGGIFEGFSKNLALGMNQVGVRNVVNTIIVTLWGMLGFLLLPILWLNLDSSWIMNAGVILIVLNYVIFSFTLYLLEKNLAERGTAYVILYPVYFIMFWIITALSWFKTNIKKEISWKNRNYAINS